MSKTSVIMPAYNCSQYIHTAIASVLCQTEPDVELIVVNDGSTDETYNIVESIAAEDPRIRVINQHNSGKPSIARNRGLDQATGEFVCFLDGDDFYSRDKIKDSLRVLQQHPSANMVFHDVMFTDGAGIPHPGTYLKSVQFAETVLSASKRLNDFTFLCAERSLYYFMCTTVTTILMSSVLIRRKRLAEEPYLFPEDLTIGEDIDLWFRLVCSGGVAYIDRPLSFYRLYAGSVTKRDDRNILDPVLAHINNYKRSVGFLNAFQRRHYRRRIAYDLYCIGITRLEQSRYHEARYSYLDSLRWRLALGPLKGVLRASILDYLARRQVNRQRL